MYFSAFCFAHDIIVGSKTAFFAPIFHFFFAMYLHITHIRAFNRSPIVLFHVPAWGSIAKKAALFIQFYILRGILQNVFCTAFVSPLSAHLSTQMYFYAFFIPQPGIKNSQK
jgi:hypothetical protein